MPLTPAVSSHQPRPSFVEMLEALLIKAPAPPAPGAHRLPPEIVEDVFTWSLVAHRDTPELSAHMQTLRSVSSLGRCATRRFMQQEDRAYAALTARAHDLFMRRVAHYDARLRPTYPLTQGLIPLDEPTAQEQAVLTSAPRLTLINLFSPIHQFYSQLALDDYLELAPQLNALVIKQTIPHLLPTQIPMVRTPSHLTTVIIEGCQTNNQQDFRRLGLPNLPHIKHLALRRVGMNDDGLRCLDFSQTPKIEHLDLRGNALTLVGVDAMDVSACAFLIRLNVSNNFLTVHALPSRRNQNINLRVVI